MKTFSLTLFTCALFLSLTLNVNAQRQFKVDNLTKDEFGNFLLFNQNRNIRINPKMIMVSWKEKTSKKTIEVIENVAGIIKVESNSSGTTFYTLKNPEKLIRVVNKLISYEEIEGIELDQYGSYNSSPDDPHFPLQWHLNAINWDCTTLLGRSTVAVIDAGINWEHEDLIDNMSTNQGEDAWNNPASGNGIDDDGNGFIDDYRGWNFSGNSNSPKNLSIGHATQVAGVLGARTNNTIGIAGVAGGNNGIGGAKIMNLQAGDSFGPTTAATALAIDYAVENGAQVINFSGTFSSPSSTVSTSITNAVNSGVVVICAAGNDGGAVNFPATLSNVIAVSGVNQNDELHFESNFGSQIDIAAPYPAIITTTDQMATNLYTGVNNIPTVRGTSFSAPIISGLAASLLIEYPCLTPEQIKTVITMTAEKVGGVNYTRSDLV